MFKLQDITYGYASGGGDPEENESDILKYHSNSVNWDTHLRYWRIRPSAFGGGSTSGAKISNSYGFIPESLPKSRKACDLNNEI